MTIAKIAKQLGLKVADARKSIRITVRDNDIINAAKLDHEGCAFALACKRQFHVQSVFFFRTTAWVQRGRKLERFTLPPSVQKEIVAFDRTQNMEAGVYQLTRPAGTQKLGQAQKRAPKRRSGTGKSGIKKKFVHRMTGIRGQTITT